MKKTKNKKKPQLEMPNDKATDLEAIRLVLDKTENNLRQIRKILFNTNYKKDALNLIYSGNNSKVIEGVFNGEAMIDKDGKTYSVPPNYASKSKLVPGDILKLTIASDGSFIYKQISPTERKKIIGILNEDNGRFYVTCEGKNYNVLAASITYFKAKPKDKLSIIVPKNKPSDWAAVENKI